jgi:lipid-A-disaccharide synthase
MDVVILSNGPGEITTWVKPVVTALRSRIPNPEQLRISVILSPCPNATGREGDIARHYPEVDRVQDARHFWSFLLRGNTPEKWDWRDQGVVVFLGGDQIYPVIVGRRLRYKTVIYAEWFANWPRWVDAFGVMTPSLVDQAPAQQRHKFWVVGDLMADGRSALIEQTPTQLPLMRSPADEWIGLLPGSKRAKLTQGVPLTLAIADYLYQQRPQTRFVLPIAPTLDLSTLLSYTDPIQNQFCSVFQAPHVTFVDAQTPNTLPLIRTENGAQIFLWQDFPAHTITSQCQLCLTTVGANTAELGSLGVPMLVLLPTQQLEAMNAWDGLLGLMVNLPLVGKPINQLINRIFLAYIRNRKKLFAWPNIWAQQEIVPELLGALTAEAVGDRVLDYLAHPERLQQMRQALQTARGETGAAQKLADLVLQLNSDSPNCANPDASQLSAAYDTTQHQGM